MKAVANDECVLMMNHLGDDSSALYLHAVLACCHSVQTRTLVESRLKIVKLPLAGRGSRLQSLGGEVVGDRRSRQAQRPCKLISSCQVTVEPKGAIDMCAEDT